MIEAMRRGPQKPELPWARWLLNIGIAVLNSSPAQARAALGAMAPQYRHSRAKLVALHHTAARNPLVAGHRIGTCGSCCACPAIVIAGPA